MSLGRLILFLEKRAPGCFLCRRSLEDLEQLGELADGEPIFTDGSGSLTAIAKANQDAARLVEEAKTSAAALSEQKAQEAIASAQ